MIWKMGLKVCFCLIVNLVLFISACVGIPDSKIAESNGEQETYDIVGEVVPPDYMPYNKRAQWIKGTTVYIRGGHYVGFISKDGDFIIPNVPFGSYVVEVISGNHLYEPVRVEINSKGKFRARKLNYLQSSQVITVPYPLKLKTLGTARYFQMREQWRLTDLLLNPMVLMMVVPLLCIMLLPRVMNDPDAKKDMEQFQSLTNKYDMPEVSEMITSFFSGGSDKQVARTSNSGTNKHNRKGGKSN